MADDKTITLTLTREEGDLLWNMLAQKSMTPHSNESARELATGNNIIAKIRDASKAAGIGMPTADKYAD